jgi:propionyl-CoA carboxylase alpha chain
MIHKVLIANRGEIACRIIKTLKKLNIKSVAVYSESDASSKHVAMADEAIFIGPSEATLSYLNGAKIIEEALKHKVDAIHPGYGFLSENAAFAEDVQKVGLIFIGPQPEAIRLLGDKIQAKTLAEKMGVPLVPGALNIQSSHDALKAAQNIDFPLILKAAAGGGGKGMRVVYNNEDLPMNFERAQSEALKSFSNGTLFLEKYIENPRHIEIQIAADHHGHVWALYDRECSIQRRHQKVIEEAPSPFLTEETRQKMMEASITLIKAANYKSLGTVEFIVDQAGRFYFLEVNTRLQVEHPVTECITGLDLVELMLYIAEGKSLKDLEKPQIKGHALEVRLCSEDPERNFMPSTGRIQSFILPPQEDIRLDTGVREGDAISLYYDSMIAKIITHQSTRSQAIDCMMHALDGLCLTGIQHNASFLRSILDSQQFREGDTHTGLIEHLYGGHFEPQLDPQDKHIITLMAAFIYMRLHKESSLTGPLFIKWGEDVFEAIVDNDVLKTSCLSSTLKDFKWDLPLIELTRDAILFKGYVRMLTENQFVLTYKAQNLKLSVYESHVFNLYKKLPKLQPVFASNLVCAPMPGLLSSIAVQEGDVVKVGEKLAIIEAMKMENIIIAPRAGKIIKIHKNQGESLLVDQPIFELS